MMAAAPPRELMDKIVGLLREEMGDRVREFPVEIGDSDDAGVFQITLRGAGGNVAALRGLRERVQPLMKKVLRWVKAPGRRFTTSDTTRDGDLVVRVEVAR